MHLGIIGDVHAESALLALAVARLQALNVTAILCTGDIADGAGSVDDCCAILRDPTILTVAGNHDRWLLRNSMRDLPDATSLSALAESTVDFLSALPKTRTVQTPAGSLLLCHGLGENDMASVAEDEQGYALENNFELHALIRGPHAVVVNGHTHHPMVRAFGSVAVINAGTIKANQNPCFLLLDTIARTVCLFDLPAPNHVPSRVWHMMA